MAAIDLQHLHLLHHQNPTSRHSLKRKKLNPNREEGRERERRERERGLREGRENHRNPKLGFN